MSNSVAVLDTLKFNGDQIFLKKYHAERSYEALAFKNVDISIEKVISFYDRIEKDFSTKTNANQILRLSISLHSSLNAKIEIAEKASFPACPILQIITSVTCTSGTGEQNYKWTHREFWNQLQKLKSAEADDVIAINELGHVTETSRCNLFYFDSATDLVLTPELSSGCLNGVYRRFVLENGFIHLPELGQKKMIEKNILAADLLNFKNHLFIANSVREVLPARLLDGSS